MEHKTNPRRNRQSLNYIIGPDYKIFTQIIIKSNKIIQDSGHLSSLLIKRTLHNKSILIVPLQSTTKSKLVSIIVSQDFLLINILELLINNQKRVQAKCFRNSE